MRYTGFKVGVVYIDKWWVDNWFKEFDMKHRNEVSKYLVGSSQLAVVMKDGTTIRAIKAGENACGTRLDKVFVQYGVPEEVINTYIRPMLMSSIIYE